MGRFVDTFNGAYIAAEDVGVDTQYVDWMALETKHVMGGEKVSHGGDPSPYTAQGIVNSMKAALKYLGKPVDFKGVHVAIQGVGNVGYNVTKILIAGGAKVTVADINQANVDRGCTISRCRWFSPPTSSPRNATSFRLALGGVIDGHVANSCAGNALPRRNNVLDDPNEDAVILKSRGILYVPDFIANAGGVIQLAGLYLGYTEQQLGRKSRILRQHRWKCCVMPSPRLPHAAAVALGDRRIAEGSTKKSAGQPTREKMVAGKTNAA